MIKVGDTVMFKNEEYSVINIHTPIFRSRNEVAHLLLENRNNTVVLPLTAYYKQLHEQQKQRADEYEKRWNELKKWIDEGVLINSDKYDKTGATPFKMFIRVLEAAQMKMNELEDSE